MKYSNLISASNAITAYKSIRVKLMLVIRSLLIISVVKTLKVQTCKQRSLAKGKWSSTEHTVSSFQMFHFKRQKTSFPDVALRLINKDLLSMTHVAIVVKSHDWVQMSHLVCLLFETSCTYWATFTFTKQFSTESNMIHKCLQPHSRVYTEPMLVSHEEVSQLFMSFLFLF